MQNHQKQEKIAAEKAAKQLAEILKDYPWFIGVLVVGSLHTGIRNIWQLRVFARSKDIGLLMAVPPDFQGLKVGIYANPDAEEVLKKMSAKKGNK